MRFFSRSASRMLLAAGLIATVHGTLHAQYFGRNKVQYQDFHFQVLKTDHFDVYFYPEERAAAEQAARMAERWYARLSSVLGDSLHGRQPLLLYSSSTHFQQTNAVEGDIGEGTGGVTESSKRRVVLPFGVSLAETDHVLGHELTHAFQYDITSRGGVGSEPGATALPLWFIEGMAEYMSLGPLDPFTAMWMRDAVLQNDLPNLRHLDDPKYFPYRYGQAFWGYIGGRYGDDVVGQLLRAASRSRDPKVAMRQVLNEDPDSVIADWHAALRTAFATGIATPRADTGHALQAAPPVATMPRADTGVALLTKATTGGRLSVGPALSPDGSQVIFLSERELFSIDMFLADAQTGHVERRLTSTAYNPHLESIQFIYSSGAWHPDGRRFALAATVRGRPSLEIINVANGHSEREIRLQELDEIFNPAFSPDGNQIAFSAQVGGVTDLFVYDLAAGQLRRLTNDAFADLQPAWSPDGASIAFVTDRFGTDADGLKYGALRLAQLDVASGRITPITTFGAGSAINPQWSADGRSLFFLANPDGITNVYRTTPASGELFQVTDLPTGASGITAVSPALAVATHSDRLVFSLRREGLNEVYRVDGAEALRGRPVSADLSGAHAVTLAVGNENARSRVSAYLADAVTGLPPAGDFTVDRYHSRLSLDYIAPPTLTGGTSPIGTFIGGGSALLWSSMLGDQQLLTALQVNGTFKDIMAEVAYFNRRHRANWGIVASQIPYLTGAFGTAIDNSGNLIERQILFRQTERQLAGVIQYPFSRVSRAEFQAGVTQVSFDYQERDFIFNSSGFFIGDSTTNLGAPPSLALATGSAALVYDNSLFGGTGPIVGRRWRLEASPAFGSINYVGALADIRQYLMPVRPLTLAARVLHYGRYGSGSNDPRLTPLFIGYQGLVRGHDVNSFSAGECDSTAASTTSCPVFDKLIGSRILIGNAEARLPLFGPLGVLARGFPLPADLVLFADAGVAWTSTESPRIFGGTRGLASSVGTGLRLNLFGILIGEIDAVRPLDRPSKGWMFQFSLTQGGF